MVKPLLLLALGCFAFGACLGFGHPFYGACLMALIVGLGHAALSPSH